jgi:hypothetical protein
MALLRISILDPSKTTKTEVEVPDDIPSQRLVKALVGRMGFPPNDQRGQPIAYRLGYSRNGVDTEILPDQTLADVGTRNDEQLRLYADMQAGGTSTRDARRGW